MKSNGCRALLGSSWLIMAGSGWSLPMPRYQQLHQPQCRKEVDPGPQRAATRRRSPRAEELRNPRQLLGRWDRSHKKHRCAVGIDLIETLDALGLANGFMMLHAAPPLVLMAALSAQRRLYLSCIPGSVGSSCQKEW